MPRNDQNSVITEITQDPSLKVRFARKPANLQEVLVIASDDSKPESVVVSETRTLSPEEYDLFASMLLFDRAWLAGKGGYPDGIRRHVVEVRSMHRTTLYVDPSGGAYGRYVGIAVEQ